MKNRILLVLLLIAAIAGIGAVVWYILRPALPTNIVTQQPGSTQKAPEVPFNATPVLPKPVVTTNPVDATSPAELERQAQEALKREALSMAARLNTYSNADGFDALRVMQASVDLDMVAKLEAQRLTLRRDHPSFGSSWGQTMQGLSAVLNSPPPILTATQASVSVQVQVTVEDASKAPAVSQKRIDLSFKRHGDSWLVSDMAVQTVE